MAGDHAEGGKEGPAQNEEGAEKRAADTDFEVENEGDEGGHGERTVADLAEGVAEDDPDTAGVDLSMDVEPVASCDPGDGAEAEQESLDVGKKKEFVPEVERLAEAVGEFESGGGQESVR